MAALSALLKTWVILQTLCLALAQVVSGQGQLGPAQLRLCFSILGFSGDKGPWKGPEGSGCLDVILLLVVRCLDAGCMCVKEKMSMK